MMRPVDDPPRLHQDILPDTPDADLLDERGFSGFIRLMSTWMRWCRNAGIILGPGRGSAVASPTLRRFGIVCPDLPETDWRRFIGPDKMPDIDVDVSASGLDMAWKLLEDACPPGWSPVHGVTVDKDGTTHPHPCAVFIIPDNDADVVESTDARILEQAGWYRLDLLASVELDTIALAVALTDPVMAVALRNLSDATWRPMHEFTPPIDGLDWTSHADPDSWKLVSQCPAAFFQCRRPGLALEPVASFDDMTRQLARMRPGWDDLMPFQEDRMRVLEEERVCSFSDADRARHDAAMRQRILSDARDISEKAARAARLLYGGYGFSRAHAVGYAAILDFETRLARRWPWQWAAALYDTDPLRNHKAFHSPDAMTPLVGRLRPDPEAGAFLGGVAHIPGIGPVQAHALRDLLLDGGDGPVADRPGWTDSVMSAASQAARKGDYLRTGRLLAGPAPSTPIRLPADLVERARRAVQESETMPAGVGEESCDDIG